MSTRSRTVLVATGLVALGLGLRLYGLDWGLPAVYEEAYPLKKSWDMWGWGAKKFDWNPHFFNYPSLYFYVQLLGQALLYVILKVSGAVATTLDFRVLYALDKTSFYILGRGITALCGTATVLATFLVGRRVGGLAAATAAAALVAVNQVHISKSQVIEVDVPLGLLSMLCLLWSLRVLEAGGRRDTLVAALFGGLATSTKYNGALLALPIVIARLLAARRAAALGGEVERRTLWVDLGLAALVFATSFLATSPYVLLDRQNFWLGFNYERLHMQMGHFGLDDTPAVLWYMRVLTKSLLGWPLSLLAAAGLVWFTIVRRQGWALVLAVFPVVYVVLISSLTMKAERYVLPLVPVAAIFAAAFAADQVTRMPRLGRRAPGALLAILVVVQAAPSVAAYRRDLARLRGDTRTLAREWIEANVPPGSFVAAEPYGPEPFAALDVAALEPDVRERVSKIPNLKVYALFIMPMYQVRPENTAIFYDLRLYEDVADLIVVSSSVGSRYRRNPSLFRAQCDFYDALDRGWRKLREFGPQDGSGPRLVVYGNPKLQTPFSQRRPPAVPPAPPVVPDQLPGAFSSFFERYAFNYETYGFYDGAAAVYRMGLRYTDQPPDLRRSMALGAVRNAIAGGHQPAALALLEELAAAAATAKEAKYWTAVRAQIAAASASGDSSAAATPR